MTKVKLLDKVLEGFNLDVEKEYDVIRKETDRDDLYYIVKNEKGEEIEVHELLAIKVKSMD